MFQYDKILLTDEKSALKLMIQGDYGYVRS